MTTTTIKPLLFMLSILLFNCSAFEVPFHIVASIIRFPILKSGKKTFVFKSKKGSYLYNIPF
ncbi:MAG: hypothetical protein Q7R70_07075 [Candidatus Diapherotrites archaeon]|nr:hypothetical protein [Candidatus Diapherotrites archaeon]